MEKEVKTNSRSAIIVTRMPGIISECYSDLEEDIRKAVEDVDKITGGISSEDGHVHMDLTLNYIIRDSDVHNAISRWARSSVGRFPMISDYDSFNFLIVHYGSDNPRMGWIAKIENAGMCEVLHEVKLLDSTKVKCTLGLVCEIARDVSEEELEWALEQIKKQKRR